MSWKAFSPKSVSLCLVLRWEALDGTCESKSRCQLPHNGCSLEAQCRGEG